MSSRSNLRRNKKQKTLEKKIDDLDELLAAAGDTKLQAELDAAKKSGKSKKRERTDSSDEDEDDEEEVLSSSEEEESEDEEFEEEGFAAANNNKTTNNKKTTIAKKKPASSDKESAEKKPAAKKSTSEKEKAEKQGKGGKDTSDTTTTATSTIVSSRPWITQRSYLEQTSTVEYLAGTGIGDKDKEVEKKDDADPTLSMKDDADPTPPVLAAGNPTVPKDNVSGIPTSEGAPLDTQEDPSSSDFEKDRRRNLAMAFHAHTLLQHETLKFSLHRKHTKEQAMILLNDVGIGPNGAIGGITRENALILNEIESLLEKMNGASLE